MKNLIGIWPNISRAYEIAMLGNFTIQVVFDKDYKQGFDDYENIKNFYNKVNFVKNGDLIVEIFKPDYKQKTETCESKDDIHKRVETAKKNIKPDKFKNSSCDALLDSSIRILDFSLKKRNKAIDISKTIAQLDNSKTIEAIQMVEAIQYAHYDYTKCNAEEKYINFGNGIQISLHEIYVSDIEKAISYLNGLIDK